MASFRTSIDLLSLKKAKLVKMPEKEGLEPIPYVCIPVVYNDIKLHESPLKDKDAEGNNAETKNKHAYLMANMWPIQEAYFNKAVEMAKQRGDEAPNRDTFQSHKIELSVSDDYVLSIIDVYGKKLVEHIVKLDAGKNKDLANMDPKDKNGLLFKLIRRNINSTIGKAWVMKSNNIPASVSHIPVAQGVSGYTPSESNDGFYINNDDLPF